jgi:hypothetical protein
MPCSMRSGWPGSPNGPGANWRHGRDGPHTGEPLPRCWIARRVDARRPLPLAPHGEHQANRGNNETADKGGHLLAAKLVGAVAADPDLVGEPTDQRDDQADNGESPAKHPARACIHESPFPLELMAVPLILAVQTPPRRHHTPDA